MTEYLVTWKIDIDADSPEEAAAQALICQRDPESTATIFEVTEKPVVVDLYATKKVVATFNQGK